MKLNIRENVLLKTLQKQRKKPKYTLNYNMGSHLKETVFQAPTLIANLCFKYNGIVILIF